MVSFTLVRSYDNVQWQVVVMLSQVMVDFKDNAKSIDQIKKYCDEHSDKAITPSLNILSMSFQNSLQDIIPTCVIQVQDNGFIISDILKSQGVFIYVFLQKTPSMSSGQILSNQVMQMDFVVYDYHIVGTNMNDGGFITYQIKGQCAQAIPLFRLCPNYSTMDNTGQPCLQNPYDIALHLLRESGMKLQETQGVVQSTDKDGNVVRNVVPTRFAPPKTTGRHQFTTCNGMTLLDAVAYLFCVNSAGDTPPPFMVFSMLTGKMFITDMRTLASKQFMDLSSGSARVPFSMSQNLFFDMHNMSDLMRVNQLGRN